jgi:hypothetical protein
MRKTLLALMIALIFPEVAVAEGWSVGTATGPFVFGHFIERTSSITTELGSGSTKSIFSAATRPGAAVDLQRDFNDRLSLRMQGTWTSAPVRIKSTSGNTGVTIDAGHLNVTTFVAPLVLQINPHGAVRFHLMAGPAYALYRVHRRGSEGATLPLFEGTRGRWGGAAGVGVAWWWSSKFAVEWRVADIVTASPFRARDIAPSSRGVRIPKPQNGYTAVGIRYRF